MWLEALCIGAVALLCRGNVAAVAATVVLHQEVNTATAGKSILVLSLSHTVSAGGTLGHVPGPRVPGA